MVNLMYYTITLVWSILDLSWTIKYSSHPGFSEGNPIAAFMLKSGIIYLYYYKIILSTIILSLLFYLMDVEKKYARLIKFCCIVVWISWSIAWIHFFIMIG